MRSIITAAALCAGLAAAGPAVAQGEIDNTIDEALAACEQAMSAVRGPLTACDVALAREDLTGLDRAVAHYLRATGRLGSGDIAGARADADAILAQSSDPAMLVGAGRIKLGLGEPAMALNLAERALAAEPEMVAAMSLKASALVALTRTDEAIEIYEALREAWPEERGVASQLALAYLQSGATAKARRLVQESLAAEPDDHLLHYARGQLLLEAGDTAEAIEAVTRALAGGDAPTIYAVRAGSHLILGDLAAAQADLAKVAEPTMLTADALIIYAVTAHAVEDDERAVEAFKLIQGHGLMTPHLQTRYAEALLLLDRIEEARAQAAVAVAADPKIADAWVILGHAALAEDPQAAADFYRRSLRVDPKSYAAQYGLAEASMSLNDYAAAEKAYSAMLAVELSVDGLLGRASARGGRGDQKGAWKDFDEALRAFPADPAVRSARGDMHYYADDLASAQAEYEAGLAVSPDDPYLLISRAIVFRDLGQFDAALRDINAGLAAHPEDQPLIAQKGMVYYLMDDPLSAMEWLDKAIAMNPQDAYSLWARGQAKTELGDAAGGAADTAEALRLDPRLADRI